MNNHPNNKRIGQTMSANYQDVLRGRRVTIETLPAEKPNPYNISSRPLPSDVPNDFLTRTLARVNAGDFSYDPWVAYALSIVAGWSYADSKALQDKLAYYRFPACDVHEISVANPAMAVIASGYFLRSRCGRLGILSFRGTQPDSVVNWLTDADVQQRAVAGGKIHAGFYANLQAVWGEICRLLLDALPHEGEPTNDRPSQPAPERAPLQALYVTGHSLGAAMAAIAAAKLFNGESPIKLPHELVAGVYTFGQPAVGDLAFAHKCKQRFNDRMYRHVYAYDVVPHLPPRSFGHFEHFGRELLTTSIHQPWAEHPGAYSQQARLLTAVLAVSITSFFARRIHWLAKQRMSFFPYSMDDHSPVGYIEASRAALD